MQPGPRSMVQMVGKRLKLQGFIVSDHPDAGREWAQQAAGWLQDGSLVARETFVAGLENAPQAFIDLHQGANTGKMLVTLEG